MKDIQEILHEIKNTLLKVRMGGARIYRASEPGEYFEKFKSCYKDLVAFCDKYRIKELLEMSDVIEEIVSAV